MPNHPAAQQISLSLSVEQNAIAPATAVSQARALCDLATVRKNLLEENDSSMTFSCENGFSPFAIAITPSFSNHIRSLHSLLDIALVDVVERWYSDQKAKFPSRMPLEKHEDGLLRWIVGPGNDPVTPFAANYGMWRSDFLIGRDSDGSERATVCEINSRIPYNGFWVVGTHEGAMKLLETGDERFASPNDFEMTRQAIFGCLDTSKPLHHIRSAWQGVDSHYVEREYEKRFGQPFLVVEPSQLRVKPDPTSPTGYKLCYVSKNSKHMIEPEDLQPIDQCSLELFQHEYAELDEQILRQIAMCRVNDLRNVFLIHDKRILGILQEELPILQSRGIITSAERVELQSGIATTLLAGTPALRGLLQRSKDDSALKDKYIIKPVRDASDRGIKLGSKITQKEWLEILEHHAERPLLPHEGACVIQEKVDHIWYDIMRHDLDTFEPEKFHLIGSQHMINSKLSVHGPWRIGQDTHVGLGEGKKGIVMSCVLRPENLPNYEGKED